MKSSGTLTISQTDLKLEGHSTLTSTDNLTFENLNLNDFTLTLGSSTSDLTVENAITIDASTEGILTGGADLLLSALSLSAGDVTSTGGIVSLSGGGQLSGTGKFDVSGSTDNGTEGWVLGGDFVKQSGTLTMSQTDLKLEGNSTLTSDVSLNFENLNLNDFTLTLGSSTSDLTVTDNLTFDNSNEQIHTQFADLTLNGLLSVDNGGLYSSGGTLTFGGGLNQTSGELDIDNSTLSLNADLNKTGGTLQTSGTSITILSDLNITSNSRISAKTVELGNRELSLGSETSDLVLSDNLSLQDTDAFLNTGDADLTVEGDFTLAQGKLESTSGKLIFRQGGTQSGSSEFDLGVSILYLGAGYTKSGGNLLSSSATLDLLVDLAITSDSALSFNQLNLNNKTLTLGSESTDLQVSSALTFDSSNELVMTGAADFVSLASLDISDGGVISTGGTISLLAGGQLFDNGTINSGTGKLDVSGSTWVLGGDFEKSSGTLTISQTDLKLEGHSTLTSTDNLTFENLNLNDFTLTLGSSTSDLTVADNITIDSSGEGILTGAADFVSLASLDISDGGVISTGGTISLLAGGQLFDNGTINSGTGKLDVSGSTWVLGGDFVKSSGTLIDNQTDLKLSGHSTLTSDEALSFVNLNLNDFTLTLGSSTSDLTVVDNITIDSSTEGILTGAADFVSLASLDISDGGVISTGGTISLLAGGQLFDNGTINSGTGKLDVSGSTWVLGGDFVKSSGTLTMLQTDLKLDKNLTLTSDVALNFENLNLNDFTLTLGSSTSDLTVVDNITIDASTEGILTGGADFVSLASLDISDGGVISTGGTISLLAGGQLFDNGTINSGTGILDVSGSTWGLGGDFVKSSGTLTMSQTDLKLEGNSTLTSTDNLTFENLNLNDFTLTLGSSTSDLTVADNITIDASTEGISSGEADLTVEGDFTLAQGKLESTSGKLIFRQGGTQSGSSEFDLGVSILYLGAGYTKSGGNLLSSSATLDLLVDLAITSDSALSFNQLNLNNKTLTLGSESTDLQVSSALTFDSSNELVMTGAADFVSLASLDISDGGVISTGGTISLLAGGQLFDNGTINSGTGTLDVSGSTWVLGGDFVKSSGTLTMFTNRFEIGRAQHIDKYG